ncbi:hypothetical protein V6N13_031396 [Hibiscus sabdariffa]|uniref:Uncharacterized protein n=1 Tax=Hibiscus sabdariffa TaxID=183260 RepID=A0ABR2CKG4_9ROSI
MYLIPLWCIYNVQHKIDNFNGTSEAAGAEDEVHISLKPTVVQKHHCTGKSLTLVPRTPGMKQCYLQKKIDIRGYDTTNIRVSDIRLGSE